MCFLLNFFLATLSFSSDNFLLSKTSILEVGDKFPIHVSRTYHFSKKDKVALYDQNSKKPFLIGIEPGLIEFKTDSKKTRKLLILSKDQIKFIDETKSYISKAPHLYFAMDGNTLNIEGKVYDLKELSFLLNECSEYTGVKLLLSSQRQKDLKQKIFESLNLQTFFKDSVIYSSNPHHKFHRCLSEQENTNKEFLTHIALVEDELFNTISSGLGAENALDWVFTDKFIVDNFSGSLDFRKIKNSLKQDLNFKTIISKDSPLSFSDGTEVQVIDQQGLFSSRNSWKKALTAIDLNLLSENSPEIILETKLSQTLRTGETGVFKTNSYQKKSSLQLDQWKQLISFNKKSDSKSRNRTLNNTFLGKKSDSEIQSNYSLWIKVNKYE